MGDDKNSEEAVPGVGRRIGRAALLGPKTGDKESAFFIIVITAQPTMTGGKEEQGVGRTYRCSYGMMLTFASQMSIVV